MVLPLGFFIIIYHLSGNFKCENPFLTFYIFDGSGTHNFPYHFCEQIGKEIRDVSDEIPFEIPDGWEWCRLGDICRSITDGDHQPPQVPTGKPFIVISNVSGKFIDFSNTRFVPDEYYNSLDENRKPKTDDILFTVTGSYGIVMKIDTDKEFCFQRHIALLKPVLIDSDFLVHWLTTPLVYGQCKKKATGTAQKTVGLTSLKSIIVPLPPLAEQHRIVAKIEELLPYIEQYEQAETKLAKLNADFPEALKKSILQEAVQGRLVPQNPDDEPASVLLERIRAEKQEIIKAGKIKKSKHESTIVTLDKIPYEISDGKERCIAHEVPFEIPDGWEWCRFSTVMINRDSERIPLSVAEREKLDKVYDYYGASGVIDKVDKYLFNTPLLLIGEDGANLLLRSKPIAFIAKGKYWVNNHAHVLDTVGGLSMEYICTYINAINLSPYVTGTAQPKMNQEKMNSILVPIPPMEEQHRIVAKIEELMPIINRISK